MLRLKCCICNSNINHIYEQSNIPIKLSCTNKPKFKQNNLSFSQCINCKTIQLDKLIPLDILYSKSHNFNMIGNLWNNYFDYFVSLIDNLIYNKNILEIGCPSGKIANKSNNYNKWFIIEPNKNTNIIFNEKINFISTYFDQNFNINEIIHIIIHSHLFEHIYDFDIFLQKCYDILCDNGQMIFSIPDMDYIQKNNIAPFLGIFFEHTVFLNVNNVKYLLNKNNFEICNIYYYNNHSIIFHCSKKNILNCLNTYSNILIDNTNLYNDFFNCINIYNEFILKCNNIITSKNIYIFGASYNTQLLIAFGLSHPKLKGILDNCFDKQNKYLYGFNLQIYNPNILINNDCIVILKNGLYCNEIYNQIINLNNKTIIIT